MKRFFLILVMGLMVGNTFAVQPARKPFLHISVDGKPVKIGNDCWIGGNAIILPGIKIGDGSIIGAGSVVTRDIPEHVMAAGNPAKVLKKLK